MQSRNADFASLLGSLTRGMSPDFEMLANAWASAQTTMSTSSQARCAGSWILGLPAELCPHLDTNTVDITHNVRVGNHRNEAPIPQFRHMAVPSLVVQRAQNVTARPQHEERTKKTM